MKLFEELHFTEYFTDCCTLLNDYKWIFQNANTKFVGMGTLDEIPIEWIRDMNSASVEEFNQIPFGYINENWCDSFKHFLHSVREITIRFKYVNRLEQNCTPRLKGISPKKLYEIKNLTDMIANTCKGDEIIWDFGSGLGYLSQNLHLKLGNKVMGVEGDTYRVQTSRQRLMKYFPDSINNVKFVEHFIDENSYNFLEATSNSLFPSDCIPKYALVGLHACADLSVTAIKMFLRNETITKLVMMPCCYHKLQAADHNCTRFHNIPVSGQLREILPENILRRPFLRLGCQQTSSRWKKLSGDDHESHGKAMFERSLVDAILDDGESVILHKTKNSGEGNALDRYKLISTNDSKSWSSDHFEKLEALLRKYPDGGRLAEHLTCLQTCLQSVCENVILLDRISYIDTEALEQGLKIRRQLVKFANDELSPRCFVFVVEKIK